MSRASISVVALTILTAVSCQKAPTSATPTIGTLASLQGTVLAVDTYRPLKGVRVSIGATVTLTTGSNGAYAVSDLPGGTTTLIAELPGFRRFSEAVTLEGAKTINIFLSPSP